MQDFIHYFVILYRLDAVQTLIYQGCIKTCVFNKFRTEVCERQTLRATRDSAVFYN